MRVIPRGSVQLSLKLVGVALARGNGALVDTGDTVLPWRASLQETMPMKRSALLRTGDVVVQSDLDSITPVTLNGRSRVCPIDEENTLLVSIRGYGATTDGKVVSANDTSVGRRIVWVGIGRGLGSPWKATGKRVVRQESRQLGSCQRTVERSSACDVSVMLCTNV